MKQTQNYRDSLNYKKNNLNFYLKSIYAKGFEYLNKIRKEEGLIETLKFDLGITLFRWGILK
jgi:hypothetical protein